MGEPNSTPGRDSTPDKNPTTDKLLALFDKVVAGGLQDAERQELQQCLRESDSLRSDFRQYVATHVELASAVRIDRSRKAVYARIREGASGLPSKAVSDAPSTAAATEAHEACADRSTASLASAAPAASVRRFWTRSLSVVAAVAAVLCISLVHVFYEMDRGLLEVDPSQPPDAVVVAEMPTGKPPAPVATLASQDAAEWQGPQLINGTVFNEGDAVSLRSGAMRISVGFGAEITASAPCTLQFLSADRVKLHEGKVAIDVAPWAKGYTVVTSDMNIVDLGTTFTVSAAPGRATEAAVLKGVVRVHSSKAGSYRPRGLLVTEGKQVSIDDSGLFDSIELKDAAERLRELDFGSSLPYRPVATKNTGLGLSIGDEDLHWRVIAGPAEGFAGPEFASVCPPERGYLPNDPNASQWVSIADWKTATPDTIYTFQTQFDLQGYDLTTMQLFGRFLADNGVVAVRVNGQPAQVNSWIDNEKLQTFGDLQFRFVNVTEGLVDGRNVIEIDVRNGMMRQRDASNQPILNVPNPMALRVEWYAFGRQVDLASANMDTGVLRSQTSPAVD